MFSLRQNQELTCIIVAPVRFLRFPTDVHIKSGETAVFDCVLSKPNAEVNKIPNRIIDRNMKLSKHKYIYIIENNEICYD